MKKYEEKLRMVRTLVWLSLHSAPPFCARESDQISNFSPKKHRCHHFCFHRRFLLSTMSGSDLLPLVAQVLRDKAVVEAAEEIESLRKQLMEARLSHRKIEIVAADGTVLATASLEGIEPKKDNSFFLSDQFVRELASVRVPVTMVDGIRANKKLLDHLRVRIGGIDAYKLGNHRPLLFNHHTDNDQDEQYFALKIPSVSRGHVVTDENIYQLDVDGHKLVINDIIFACGPGVYGRHDLLDVNNIDEHVVFKTIKFSALVEKEMESSNSFVSTLRHLFRVQQTRAEA